MVSEGTRRGEDTPPRPVDVETRYLLWLAKPQKARGAQVNSPGLLRDAGRCHLKMRACNAVLMPGSIPVCIERLYYHAAGGAGRGKKINKRLRKAEKTGWRCRTRGRDRGQAVKGTARWHVTTVARRST